MKLKPISCRGLAALLAAAVGLGLLSGGCATRGYKRAEATADSIGLAASEIERAQTGLRDATSALDVLLNRNPEDLRASFERYRTAVAALEETYGALTRKAEEMDADGERYFAEWDKRVAAMHSEDIRARSLARQQEMAQRFRDIQQGYRDARVQFPPLLTRLRDIQQLLGVDLTPAGIASARGFVDEIEEGSARLRQTLDQLAERFRGLSSNLQPGAA